MKDKTRSQIHIRYFLLVDIFLTAFSVLIAFALRLDDKLPVYLSAAYWTVLLSLLIKPIVYYLFGLYRRLWAYASVKELTLISTAVTAATAIFSTVMMILYTTRILNFPRMMLPIDWLLSLVGIGGFRFSIRMIADKIGRASCRERVFVHV
jgi:FlaA1/EpsC-like NDP-sugar epimerase